MKFSIALTAVLLPAFVNAQYGGDTPSSSSSSSAASPSSSASNSNTINVRLAFVIPSIFVDVPQVAVGAGGALAYNPSAITAANGTTVTFVFAQYISLRWVFAIAIVLTHFTPGAFLIPSRNLRSQTPARTWPRATARQPGSILVYRLESSLPSRSQMIKRVSQHFHFSRSACIYLITATAVWFFCKAPAHCGAGMVG